MKLALIYLATTILAASIAIAVISAPARAQIHTAPQPQTMGIPCRISWDVQTHGGDTLSAHGEAELTQIAPQGDGRFVAFGAGHATVTYHSANGCTMVGSPWTASYDVTVASEDGNTAQVDIGSDDDEHSVTATRCLGNADFQYDTEPPGLPRVTVELHEGTTQFSTDHDLMGRHAGRSGAVTLHYCALPEQH